MQTEDRYEVLFIKCMRKEDQMSVSGETLCMFSLLWISVDWNVVQIELSFGIEV